MRRHYPTGWGSGLSKREQEDGSCVQNWLSLLPDHGYEVTSCSTLLLPHLQPLSPTSLLHLEGTFPQAVSRNVPFLFKAVFVRNFGTTLRYCKSSQLFYLLLQVTESQEVTELRNLRLTYDNSLRLRFHD